MITKKQIRESFPVFNSNAINYYHKYQAYNGKTERQAWAEMRKAAKRMEDEASQPDVKYIRISMTWSKNRYWGMNPTAEMWWVTADGESHYMPRAGHASGCGYDKGSTALAECLNRVAQGMLIRRMKRARKSGIPYGVCAGSPNLIGNPHFGGGIGISSYRRIIPWMKGKMTHTEGKTWDEIVITF